MKKRVFAALMAGVMGTMMFGTTFGICLAQRQRN